MKCNRRFLALLISSALAVCISAEEAVPSAEVRPEFKVVKVSATLWLYDISFDMFLYLNK